MRRFLLALYYLLAIPISLILYGIAGLIVLVVFSVILNVKCPSKFIPHLINVFGEKGSDGKPRAYSGWPTRYIKYVISHYCQIVWRCNSVSEIPSYYTQGSNRSRNHNSHQNVSNLTPIPIKEQLPKLVHADTVSQENKGGQP